MGVSVIIERHCLIFFPRGDAGVPQLRRSTCYPRLLMFLEVWSKTLQWELPDDSLYIHPEHIASLSGSKQGWVLSSGSKWTSLGMCCTVSVANTIATQAMSRLLCTCSESYSFVTHKIAWCVREMKLCVLELKLVHQESFEDLLHYSPKSPGCLPLPMPRQLKEVPANLHAYKQQESPRFLERAFCYTS